MVIMRSLRILAACMAVVGVTSIAASSAAAQENVRVPACTAQSCEIGLVSPGVERSFENTNPQETETVTCAMELRGSLRTASGITSLQITNAEFSPGDPFCIETEFEELPWQGKICKEAGTGNYSLTLDTFGFYTWLGAGEYSGSLTAQLLGSGSSPFTATAASLTNAVIPATWDSDQRVTMNANGSNALAMYPNLGLEGSGVSGC
jgi:hypothetical protein